VRGAAIVVKYLDQFEPEVAAYITARYVLNAMAKRSKLQTVALAISKALEDALNHETLQKENPGLYRQLLRKIEKSSDERYRHVLLKRQQKFAGIETVEWTMKHKLQTGELLVHLMAQSTDMIVRSRTRWRDAAPPSSSCRRRRRSNGWRRRTRAASCSRPCSCR
jgi:DNA-directed RNA polymerase